MIQHNPLAAEPNDRASAARAANARTGEYSPLWPIATLVIWLLCLAIGVLGLWLPYPRPETTMTAPEPHTELLNVKIAKEALPPPVPQSLPPLSNTQLPDLPLPPVPEVVALPDTPPVTPVAAPSAAFAFAVPVEGLTRIVNVDKAAHGRSGAAAAAAGTGGSGSAVLPSPPPVLPAAPTIGHLTLGQGEGRQPAPQYPHEAVAAHQEGVVVLRFTVAEDGRVASVEIISPSHWPLLNQAATRAVRDSWRFNPGPRRIYEVPIQFKLNPRVTG